jgi:rubrerythrin
MRDPAGGNSGVVSDESPGRGSRAELPDDAGGDPACWMHRVCQECGRLADEDPPTRCPSCGATLEAL